MRAGAALVEAIVALLAPARCPGCDGLAPTPRGFCPGCAPLLERIELQEGVPSRAGYAYGGPLADAIVRLKYGGRTDFVPALAELAITAAIEHAGAVDRVVPVPLHPTRLRARGFNQSALLAAPLARALGVPLDVRSLVRVRPTREQAGLPRDARQRNLAGAFAVRVRQPADRVLILDDVRTTGATLAEAARALTEAGCREARTFALARALG